MAAGRRHTVFLRSDGVALGSGLVPLAGGRVERDNQGADGAWTSASETTEEVAEVAAGEWVPLTSHSLALVRRSLRAAMREGSGIVSARGETRMSGHHIQSRT